MKKAILIIDMPDSCKDCPLCVSKEFIPSVDEYCCIVENTAIDAYDKPYWCPLKPAPELQNVGYDDDDWVIGYNNCVREIVGEVVDD